MKSILAVIPLSLAIVFVFLELRCEVGQLRGVVREGRAKVSPHWSALGRNCLAGAG